MNIALPIATSISTNINFCSETNGRILTQQQMLLRCRYLDADTSHSPLTTLNVAVVSCSPQTTLWRRCRHLVSHGRMQSDVTWRTVTSSTRRRERTSASVDEQDKMADWVVSTSHSQTCCTLYSQLPHQLRSSSSNTTSSFTWKVSDVSSQERFLITYYVLHREAEKRNQFLLCASFLILYRNWWIFFTYIKEIIGYNSVYSILACIKNFS